MIMLISFMIKFSLKVQMSQVGGDFADQTPDLGAISTYYASEYKADPFFPAPAES
jgi:hypothetical protein